MSFIAGQYTATLATNALGQTKEGWRVEHQFFKRKIQGDNLAKSDQDAVWQGGNVFIKGTLLEYNATGALAAFWPYGTAYLSMGVMGRLDSAIAGVLVLTAIAGTPAAAAPASITMNKVILAEGFPVDLLFYPDLREVPLRLQSYPYISSNTNVWGVLT